MYVHTYMYIHIIYIYIYIYIYKIREKDVNLTSECSIVFFIKKDDEILMLN